MCYNSTGYRYRTWSYLICPITIRLEVQHFQNYRIVSPNKMGVHCLHMQGVRARLMFCLEAKLQFEPFFCLNVDTSQ